jgi:AmmeMemoRadiSam system protein B/AmmeMemoRadiSam system protein A
MRKKMPSLILVIVLSLACGNPSHSDGKSESSVRPPAVAGQFYPDNPARLKLAIQKFMEDAVPPRAEHTIAIVVPHAGYIYSGQICADAFRQASGQPIDVVVILGTNHTTAGFDRISVYPSGAFRTPLATTEVDESVAKALLEGDKDCVVKTEVHAREHSVEVQIPFVQVLFPSAQIVPVVVGEPDVAMCSRFGQVLAKALKGRKALIVASSDLSHYPPYEDAVLVDHQTLTAIARLDPKELSQQIQNSMQGKYRNLSTCACGEAPVLAAMAAAKALGATRGIVVSYANSGDSPVGDHSRVVGYGAVAFAAGESSPDLKGLERPKASSASQPLSPSEKRTLLSFARGTLNRFFLTETVPLARNMSPRLQVPQGAFVTLKKHGDLRGCIGNMASTAPLGQTVGAMAMAAAFQDTRFTQLSPTEMKDIEIEISVLTPMKPLSHPEEIVVGRDGVVLRKGDKSGVFLPQVATEQGWNRTQLLDNLCLKAGLPTGSWKKDAQLLAFQAEVFKEAEFK